MEKVKSLFSCNCLQEYLLSIVLIVCVNDLRSIRLIVTNRTDYIKHEMVFAEKSIVTALKSLKWHLLISLIKNSRIYKCANKFNLTAQAVRERYNYASVKI